MSHQILPLIIFLFPLAYSPGPGNMFFAANGARFGFAATIPASAGYHLATWVVTAIIGLGFVTLTDQLPRAFTALRIAGALYILWLAWGLLRSGALGRDAHARPAGFASGVLLLVLNPKAYVIIGLMFSQFLPSTDGARVQSVMTITTIFTLNNLIAFSIWTVIGDSIARLFRTPETAHRLNTALALMLGVVALWLLLSGNG